MQKKDKKKDPLKESIFEEAKKEKKAGKKILEIAKTQEVEKLNNGFKYVLLADNKTRVLRKA